MYKLVAKALANRLQPFLPDCILPTQKTFVKDRCILDNVFLASEASDWAKESSQDLVILLLDFEKAYDRVSWAFLEAAMANLRFSPQWITWVSALYKGVQSSLIVNGKKLPRFDITRFVCQGCPSHHIYTILSWTCFHTWLVTLHMAWKAYAYQIARSSGINASRMTQPPIFRGRRKLSEVHMRS